MRTRRPGLAARVALVAFLPLLAGCLAPEDHGPASDPPAFDGAAARALVAGLVTNDAGEPRYRIPGTPSHADAAHWLWQHMNQTGWTRAWHNVTGADYQAMDKGAVASYTRPGSCPEDDRADVANVVFHNLWARHDAAGTDRTLLLAAHWDSKEDAEHPDGRPAGQPVLGANDGASGVGILLQWMHHVTAGDLVPPVDVVVAFFDGEDGFADCHPLAGSIAFAKQEPAGPIDRMILLDMVGDRDARFVRETRSTQADPGLVDLLWQHGRALGGTDQFTDQERSVIDDHLPFLDQGVAAVDLIDFGRSDGRSGFPPYWHTPDDTMENIHADMLALVGDTLWATVTDSAFVATWP